MLAPAIELPSLSQVPHRKGQVERLQAGLRCSSAACPCRDCPACRSLCTKPVSAGLESVALREYCARDALQRRTYWAWVVNHETDSAWDDFIPFGLNVNTCLCSPDTRAALAAKPTQRIATVPVRMQELPWRCPKQVRTSVTASPKLNGLVWLSGASTNQERRS